MLKRRRGDFGEAALSLTFGRLPRRCSPTCAAYLLARCRPWLRACGSAGASAGQGWLPENPQTVMRGEWFG